MNTSTSGCRHRWVGLGSTAVVRPLVAFLALSCLAIVAVQAAALPPTCDEAPYDIDGNSEIDPLADGLLMLRYFFGFRGDVLISDALGEECTRCDAPEIEAFIANGLTGCQCGNDFLEPGEDCDGADVGGNTCLTEGFASGDLGCTASCTFDVTACTLCGNGVINEGELCDINDLGGLSCISFGFLGGNLLCTDACSFDTSQCEQ